MLEDKEDKEEEKRRRQEQVAGAVSAGQSADISAQRMAGTYRKPDAYTGNRKLFDDGQAKRVSKENLFKSGKTVRDPYTGEELLLRRQDAKLKYGKKWTEHLAEADHIQPVHKVFEEYKDSPFVTNDDIKEVVNGQDNLKPVSRKLNNAKRDRTNDDFYSDTEYLEKKEISLSKRQCDKAIADGKKAESEIQWKLRGRMVKNAAKEFHSAGTQAAMSGAVMTGAMAITDNLIAVLKGEKKPSQAVKDVALATGQTAAVSYFTGGGLSVVTQALSASSNEMVKTLAKSGAPGKVVAAVMATAGTLKRYFNGDISAEDCFIV